MSVHWPNALTRQVFDNWQFTGIFQFYKRRAQAVALTTTDGADITRSPTETPRPDLVGKAEIAKDQRNQYHFFNTDAFARPAKGTVGNADKFNLRGPGISNWDMGLYKNVRVEERYRFQFQWETYNTFNHTQ